MLVISRRSDEIIVGAARIRVEMTQNMLGFLIEMRSVNIYAAVPGEDQQFVNPFVFIAFQIFYWGGAGLVQGCKRGRCGRWKRWRWISSTALS